MRINRNYTEIKSRWLTHVNASDGIIVRAYIPANTFDQLMTTTPVIMPKLYKGPGYYDSWGFYFGEKFSVVNSADDGSIQFSRLDLVGASFKPAVAFGEKVIKRTYVEFGPYIDGPENISGRLTEIDIGEKIFNPSRDGKMRSCKLVPEHAERWSPNLLFLCKKTDGEKMSHVYWR